MREQRRFWIQIIHDPKHVYERYTHVVQPGHQYLRVGDKVIFTTHRTAARIHIPNIEALFGIDDKWIMVEKNGQSDEFTVQECPRGKYPFVVYCPDGNDFAEGCTSPRMIIED